MSKSLIKSYLKVSLLFIVFLALFICSIAKDYFKTGIGVTGDFASLWYWNFLLIGFIAIFYILKIHKFYLRDFFTSIAFGIIVSLYSGFNPIITPIIVFSYYAACCIFRQYNSQKIFICEFTKSFKFIGFGILVGIIPAIFNLIEFYIQDGYKFNPVNLSGVLPAAMSALQPGIGEEIVFRFFLYAFIVNAFKGEMPKTKFVSIMTYILLILPHCWMHYPPLNFINEPILTILNLAYMCLVFGVPAVWLMKNKNLYSAISFHWFIDFIRFCIVGH